MTTKKASDLKTRRVEASITRGALAEVSGISQYRIDRIERGVDVEEDVRKAYDAGMAKLIAQVARTSTTNGTKSKARTSTAKKTTARTRKAAQPKAKTEESAA